MQHQLSEHEQEVLCAPPEVDDFGAVVLSMFSRWEKDALFVIASAFVDETGTGDEPRMLVGGVIGSVLNWHKFTVQWNRMLADENVPYAHFFEMDRREGPFSKGWNLPRKMRFMAAQFEILKNWCQLSLTVSLDKQLYRDIYRRDFPHGKECSPDSAYGVASKELILQAQRLCEELFHDVETINFVWEEGHLNLPNVEQIFRDIKRCYGRRAASLGTIIPMPREKAKPLQAIDQLIVSARKAEPAAIEQGLFASVAPESNMGDIEKLMPAGETFPTFYFDLDEKRLLWHREHKQEMAELLRQAKRSG